MRVVRPHLWVVLLLTLSAAGTAPATASANKVLELRKATDITELGPVLPEEHIEIWQDSLGAKYVGPKQTLECERVNHQWSGHDVTNSERTDVIAFTSAWGFGACSSSLEHLENAEELEDVTVSGFPVTFELRDQGRASIDGALTFTFTKTGCAYQTDKLAATVTLSHVEISGTIKRTKASPKGCETKYAVSQLGGYMETFPNVFVTGIVKSL